MILVGGLEAGIALHILNNLLAFAVAIVFGDLQGALTVSEVSWWQLPVTVAQNGVYLVLVLLVARRMGLPNRTTPPVPEPASVAPLEARQTSRSRSPCPDWWAPRRLCILNRRSAHADTTVDMVTGSHGVWGNWQPDWFWSS